MPTLRIANTATGAGTVPAGGTITNILAGSKFEFARVPSTVMVYAIGVAPALEGELTMDVTFGNAVEGDDVAIPIRPLITDGPLLDRDLLVSGVASAGDRIQIKLSNADAAVAQVVTLIKINPI